jgi:hypothetical protein
MVVSWFNRRNGMHIDFKRPDAVDPMGKGLPLVVFVSVNFLGF